MTPGRELPAGPRPGMHAAAGQVVYISRVDTDLTARARVRTIQRVMNSLKPVKAAVPVTLVALSTSSLGESRWLIIDDRSLASGEGGGPARARRALAESRAAGALESRAPAPDTRARASETCAAAAMPRRLTHCRLA